MTNNSSSITENIRKRRKELGYTQKDLAKKMGFDNHQTVSDIERGERDLKASELSTIANILSTSTNKLLKGVETIGGSTVLWREEPEDKKEKEAIFREKCEQYHFLERVLDKKREGKFSSPVEDPLNNPKNLARKMGSVLGLGNQPASSLRQTLEEDYFVKIWYLDLAESGSGACTKDDFGYGILINSNEAPWRMNFSLAHELFHLLTWEETVLGEQKPALNDVIEGKANIFAANLLLPAEDVMDHFRKKFEDDNVYYSDLIEYARRYEVSTETVIWRLHNLNLIDREDVERLLSDPDFREMDKGTMGNHWITPDEKPERFVRLVGLAYIRDKISKTKAADLLDTSLFDLEDTFNKYDISMKDDRKAMLSG